MDVRHRAGQARGLARLEFSGRQWYFGYSSFFGRSFLSQPVEPSTCRAFLAGGLWTQDYGYQITCVAIGGVFTKPPGHLSQSGAPRAFTGRNLPRQRRQTDGPHPWLRQVFGCSGSRTAGATHLQTCHFHHFRHAQRPGPPSSILRTRHDSRKFIRRKRGW